MRVFTVLVLIIVVCLGLTGCGTPLGDVTATMPVERGLSYVACAIVTHGVIGALFNN